MVAYLAVAGCVLVAALGAASSRVAQALEFRSQSRHLETAYAQSHGGDSGIQQESVRLQARLAAQLGSLKAVAARLSGDPRPARFLRALVLSLPANMSLHQMSLNAADKTIAFEVLVLGSGSDGPVGAPELMSRWQQDPAISSEIAQLAYVGSQVENAGANGNMRLQFTGRLEKGRR
jgi:hypothetical protein